jgi:hypothetical protein
LRRQTQALERLKVSRLGFQIFLASVVALASLAPGCGGGSGSDSSSPNALPKALFIKRADAICEKADKVQEAGLRRALAKAEGSLAKGRENNLISSVGLPPIQTEAEELRELGAPSGDGDKIDAIIGGIEEAVEKAEENPHSVTGKAGNPFNEVDELARAYGFKVCSEAL